MPIAGQDVPLVRSVLHPTDFSETSHAAFAYALAISLLRQTQLTLLHAGRENLAEDAWTQFPAVRDTLVRWGLLEKDSPRSAVFDELAMRIKKVNVRESNPTKAIVDYLAEDPCDLMVLATEGRSGLPGWAQRSVAEAAAERSETMTLFVPDGATRGFVSPDDGYLSLERVLIPVDGELNCDAALEIATRTALLARSDEDQKVDIILLHVGPDRSFPRVVQPDAPHCNFIREFKTGDVVEEICAAATDAKVDLIVMTTQGSHGVFDALRGSTTQQVLRQADCPLLATPAN